MGLLCTQCAQSGNFAEMGFMHNTSPSPRFGGAPPANPMIDQRVTGPGGYETKAGQPSPTVGGSGGFNMSEFAKLTKLYNSIVKDGDKK
jgi:hypothetical protein